MSCIPKKSPAEQQQFVAPPAQAMSTAVDCEERAPGDVLQGGGKGGAGVSETVRSTRSMLVVLQSCSVPHRLLLFCCCCVFTVQH
mgnify:CR=1 FL=1